MKKIIIIAISALISPALISCSSRISAETSGTEQTAPGNPDDGQEETGKTYPEGVSVTAFTDDLGDGEKCSGFIATADFALNKNLRFNIGYGGGYRHTPTEFYKEFSPSKGKPCLVINGGYFSGSASVSLAISGGNFRCHNIMKMNWPNDEDARCTVYPVRSAFGQMPDGTFEAQWIYCVREAFREYYSFPSALGNNEQTETFIAEPPTTETPGGEIWDPEEAVGGGPRLVKDGRNVAVENYWAEVFDSGGTAGLSRQPRTAIGVKADNSLIMLVCDGRGMNGSSGFTLSELADKLISLGATDAINLDGGGSSAIVGYDGTVLNRPSDTGNSETIIERPVVTAVIISEMQD